jgi:hypothetical protein
MCGEAKIIGATQEVEGGPALHLENVQSTLSSKIGHV